MFTGRLIMDNELIKKIERLNELYTKKERNIALSEQELTEQSVIRDEVINYYQFAIRTSLNNKK